MLYRITTSEGAAIELEAKSEAEAKELLQADLDNKDNLLNGKITNIIELVTKKPDASTEQQAGGYYFKAWGIHVVAESIAGAKEVVKQAYGVDVDKDIPPNQVDANR